MSPFTSYFVKCYFVSLAITLLSFTVHAEQRSLKIGGTGGGLGTLQELGNAFHKKHPNIAIMVEPSIGSSGGIKAVQANALDIGVSSRPLTEEERSQGVSAFEYGRTPFIFVSSKEHTVDNLSVEQICAIYSGKMKQWPDGTPIRLILRPKSDTDNDYLKRVFPCMETSIPEALSRVGMNTAVTDQDNLKAIEETQGGFGASSLAQVLTEKRKVNVVQINGVTPSRKTLRDGSYPFYKRFFIVTGAKRSNTVQLFIDFIKSVDGQAVLLRTGHLVAED
jgi:phosphate transport system substrate-binding protein